MLDFRQILTIHAPDIVATKIHKPEVYFQIQDGGRRHIGFSKNRSISDKYGRKSNVAVAAILNLEVHFRFVNFSCIIIRRLHVPNWANIEQLATKWQHVM